MNGSRGIKRLLLGIELTLVGIALVATISGSGGLIGLAVIAVGLVVAASGMAADA